MYVVLVIVTVKKDLLGEFERALLHNARESVKREGCVRFDVAQQQDDVAQQQDDATKWVLFEVYDSPEAHAAHLKSAHFLEYEEVAKRAVTGQVVIRATGKHVTP